MADDYKRILRITDLAAAKADKPRGCILRQTNNGAADEYAIEGSRHDRVTIDNFVNKHNKE